VRLEVLLGEIEHELREPQHAQQRRPRERERAVRNLVIDGSTAARERSPQLLEPPLHSPHGSE
jgi:hypothetical protein